MALMSTISATLKGGIPGGARLGAVSYDMFFDRQKLVGQMDKASYRALNRAGATMRMHAKRSMKARAIDKPSPVGTPPHRHTQMRGKKSRGDYGLQRSIMYGFDQSDQSVVIGPSTAFGAGIHRIAQSHEYGGTESKKNPRRRNRVRGGSGEIRIGRAARNNPRARLATKKAKGTALGDVDVTYGKLFTDEQARRANQLNETLYGPTTLRSTYPPRPTMRPALAVVAPLLPGMIRDEWNK
jgi:hypothetical protein